MSEEIPAALWKDRKLPKTKKTAGVKDRMAKTKTKDFRGNCKEGKIEYVL